MARFDVYRNPDGSGYLLDVQADLLSHLNTRLVVPLLLRSEAPHPARHLNPCFAVGDDEVVMVTQFMGAVPVAVLRTPVATLARRHTDIIDAIDMLMQGF